MTRAKDATLAFLDLHPSSKKIFVIGTGRSGTHWIGRILAESPEIRATIEMPRIFQLSTGLAIRPGSKLKMNALILQYRIEHARAAPLHYVDKSHPNIWHAEALAVAFPRAMFVGILREPYATVASMLKHPGVRGWCERWENYPLPNRFLGIREGEQDWYRSLSLTARCAQRWVSHRDRLKQLASSPIGDRLTVLSYEELVVDTTPALERLSAWLGLQTRLTGPPPQAASLVKWQETLTEADIADIRSITGTAAPT